MQGKKLKGIFIGAIIILFILIILPTSSVPKEISKDSNFQYTTSITGNYSKSDRADVYTTDMSVPDTAESIIEKKRPESYSDLSNEESIQLIYDDYYISIYKGEDLKTYVQISSRKYVHRNGFYGLYRPYSRNVILFYNNSYLSSRYYRTDSSRYGGGFYRTTKKSNIRTSSPQTNNTKTKNDSTKIKTTPSQTKDTTTKNNSTKIKTNTPKTNNTKIRTDKNSSTKIKTNSSSSSKTKTGKSSIFGSGSIRKGSISSRSSMGGGTSFGK